MRVLFVLAAVFATAMIAAGGVGDGFDDLLPAALEHVSCNAALMRLSARLGRVERDGFMKAGDGGAAIYALSMSPCSSPDGGAEVALNDGGCAIVDPTVQLTPALFGGNFPALLKAAIALNRAVYIPCGTYGNLPALPLLVPDGRVFAMRGESRECAVLEFSKEGISTSFEGVYSAVDIEDITFATADTEGRYTALQLRQAFINPNPALSATSQIAKVTFRGAPVRAAPFPFWARGFVDSGVSNINLDNITYGGSGLRQGIGLLFEGFKPDRTNSANGGYAVSVNVNNYIAFGCDSGIIRGDLVQGVTVINGQATGCHYGVALLGGAVGENDQVHIKGGQWADDRSGILCADPHTAHLIVEGGYYITVGTATAIEVCGEIPIVTHNTIGGNASPGSKGIVIHHMSPGNNALVTENNIRGLGIGIQEDKTITTPVSIINNQISDTATHYMIAPTVRNVIIVDQNRRALSNLNATIPCTHALYGSKFLITDGNTKPKFMETASGGGNRISQVICDNVTGTYVAY